MRHPQRVQNFTPGRIGAPQREQYVRTVSVTSAHYGGRAGSVAIAGAIAPRSEF